MEASDSSGWITYDIAIFFHQFTHASHLHKMFVSKSATDSYYQKVTKMAFYSVI